MVSGSSPLRRRRAGGAGGTRGGRPRDRVRDRPDVRRRGPAAAADEVDQARARRTRGAPRPCTPGVSSYCPNSFGRPAFGWVLTNAGRDPRELLDVLPERLGAQRAVEPDAERPAVRHRVPERLGGLARERAAARVGDRAGDHHRQPVPGALEERSIAKSAALALSVSKMVSTRSRSAPPSSRPRRLGVRRRPARRSGRSGSRGRSRRARARRSGWSGRAPRPRSAALGRAPLELVGGFAGQPGGGVVQLVDQLLHAVVRHARWRSS